MYLMPETIVALATPTGRSGIGVVRLSGDEALRIAARLISRSEFSPEPRNAYLHDLVNPSTGETIDQAIITYFKTPHSFTGEDVVEVSCHGSPVLLRQVIDICLTENARLADPGEFTLRALANGRMDLTEAEAVRDLIDAQSHASARQAIRQLRGEFSNQLQPLKDDLLDVIVLLESALEFVEDDLPAMQFEKVRETLARLASDTKSLAETYKAGHLIRDGLRVALVGKPNVGKSSLFNALLASDRAIVTDIPGTTRDQLHERFIISDIPVSLIDTAGLRETSDTVESIGVERSRRAMADADLVIVLIDSSEAFTDEDIQILDSVSDINVVIALNKIDKLTSNEIDQLTFDDLSGHGEKLIQISAKTGEGLDKLREAIIRPFIDSDISDAGFLITDARHHDLLIRTHDEIAQSAEQFSEKMSEEIVLIGLHNALRYLGDITGETTTDDMLTRIFSTFCIGK
jgi:tRNA modification GTPase